MSGGDGELGTEHHHHQLDHNLGQNFNPQLVSFERENGIGRLLKELMDLPNLLEVSFRDTVVSRYDRLQLPSLQLLSKLRPRSFPCIDGYRRDGKVEADVEDPDCPKLFSARRIALVPEQGGLKGQL